MPGMQGREESKARALPSTAGPESKARPGAQGRPGSRQDWTDKAFKAAAERPPAWAPLNTRDTPA